MSAKWCQGSPSNEYAGQGGHWYDVAGREAPKPVDNCVCPVADEQGLPGFAEREKRAAKAWQSFASNDREMSHEFRAGYHRGVIDEARS
jgi:hypothetical protein